MYNLQGWFIPQGARRGLLLNSVLPPWNLSWPGRFELALACSMMVQFHHSSPSQPSTHHILPTPFPKQLPNNHLLHKLELSKGQLSSSQLAAWGTKERNRLGWPVFGRENFILKTMTFHDVIAVFNESKHLKMVIRSIPDSVTLISGRTEWLGLRVTALHLSLEVDFKWHSTPFQY